MDDRGAFLDTNLLVLFVVGSVDRDQVEKHRRTRRFTVEDYDRLARLLEGLDRVFVTPNTLTEASNLLERRGDSRFLKRLRSVIEMSREIIVASTDAAATRAFERLGLTDAVLLEAISNRRPLLTVDFDLYGAALAKGPDYAVNFTRDAN